MSTLMALAADGLFPGLFAMTYALLLGAIGVPLMVWAAAAVAGLLALIGLLQRLGGEAGPGATRRA
jgi:hypothetical protein